MKEFFIILYIIINILVSSVLIYCLRSKEKILQYFFPWRLRKNTYNLNIIGCTLVCLIMIFLNFILFISLLSSEFLIWICTCKAPVKILNKDKIKYDKSLYLLKKDFNELGWKVLCESFNVPIEYNFIYCKFDSRSVKEQQYYMEQFAMKNNKQENKESIENGNQNQVS